MRAIGKGLNAAQIFCTLMNLPPPPASIHKHTDVIGEVVQPVASSVKAAANDPPIAFDGTWQKQGHTSKDSVAIVTSIDTGKVIGFEALTKHCYNFCDESTTANTNQTARKTIKGQVEEWRLLLR